MTTKLLSSSIYKYIYIFFFLMNLSSSIYLVDSGTFSFICIHKLGLLLTFLFNVLNRILFLFIYCSYISKKEKKENTHPHNKWQHPHPTILSSNITDTHTLHCYNFCMHFILIQMEIHFCDQNIMVCYKKTKHVDMEYKTAMSFSNLAQNYIERC